MPSLTMEPLKKLLLRWEREEVGILPGQPADAVLKAFASLGAQATADVVALYCAIDGMQIMDAEYWRLWSLDEVAAQKPSERGVLFADYCMSCWEYRLKPVDDERSAVHVDHYDDKPTLLVASSLQEFLERYLADARSLIDPASPTDKVG